jgi:hypothetical protein
MSAETRRPLSSTCLYHFKADLRIYKLILEHGFSHRLMTETIPYKEARQQNYATCFCDIRWEDSRTHRDCYGENAIVLTKRWGISCGVSPVRYVHHKSPGAGAEYNFTKNMLRFSRDTSAGRHEAFIQDLLKVSVLKDEALLGGGDITLAFAQDAALSARADAIDDEFMELLADAKRAGHDHRLVRYLDSLVARIVELQNEVELRDSFTRRYQEDFPCPSSKQTVLGKILYDEREWRSIKYATDLEATSALKDGCLPEAYNLRFADRDVVALVAQDQSAKGDLVGFLSRGTSLLSASFDRIFTADDYREEIAEASP